MSVSISWNHNNPHITVGEKTDFTELYNVTNFFIGTKEFDEMEYQLWDFSQTNLAVINNQEINIISIIDKHSAHWNSNLKVAFVANNDAIVEKCEYFAQNMKDTEWKVRTFQNLDQAQIWCSNNRYNIDNQFVFENKEQHLYLKLIGDYNKLKFYKLPKIMHDICVTEKYNNILVYAMELRGTDIDTIDRIFYGKEIANLMGTEIRTAVIWPLEDINKIAENTANRAGGKLYVVDNKKSAEEWLFSKS